MIMQKYRIHISYDGTQYFGWQEQVDLPTVVSTLKSSFFQTFGKHISVVGASRTDAGVHARHQVAMFSTDLALKPERMLEVWNQHLPGDISIVSMHAVDQSYSVFAQVKQKTYSYTVFTSRPNPFQARYGWWYTKPIDVEKLQGLLDIFVGTHNFRSFCTGDEYTEADLVRTIDAITLEKGDGFLVIQVQGQGFLRHMVRRIVGAFIKAASTHHINRDTLMQVLQACNPAHVLPNAPAKGLCLEKIEYWKEG
jgi:tRNA pseudouridine38-40 synthase